MTPAEEHEENKMKNTKVNRSTARKRGAQKKDCIFYHTDSLLRKHQLLIRQTGNDKFDLVDWLTYRPVSEKRAAAYLKEDAADQKRFAAERRKLQEAKAI